MAIAVLATAFVMSMLSRGLVETFTVFVLPLGSTYGWERAEVVSIYSVATIALGAAGPFAGRLFDVLGPRTVYGCGLALVTGGYLAASVAQALWQFQLFLGVMFGIGAACLGNAQNTALVGRWFRRRLALAIALVLSASGVGMLALVPLCQYLLQVVGLHDTFRIMGLASLALLGASLLLPWNRFRAGRPAPRAVRGGAGGDAPSRPRPWTLRPAMRHPAFWGLFAVYLLTAQGMYAIVVQVVPLLVDAGFTPLDAAQAWGLAGVLLPVGMISAGWLDGRIGRRPTLLLSYGLSLAGVAALWLLTLRPDPWLLALFVALFGGTLGARGPLIGTTALAFFGGPNAATILGMIGVGLGVGSAVGAWAGGALHDWTGHYGPVIVFAAVSLVAAAVVFLSIASLQPSPPPCPRAGPPG